MSAQEKVDRRRDYQTDLKLPNVLRPALEAAAAQVRASVERGDPLALRQLLTMGGQVDTRFHKGASHSAPAAAATDEAVPVDGADLAAGQVAVSPFAAGEDSAAVEHERQRRLHLWQEQR